MTAAARTRISRLAALALRPGTEAEGEMAESLLLALATRVATEATDLDALWSAVRSIDMPGSVWPTMVDAFYDAH